MTSRDEREWERRGEKVGHIGLLGVMPAYRGRSLGRALLLIGVNYLREFVPTVELQRRRQERQRTCSLPAWASTRTRVGPIWSKSKRA